MPELPDVEIYKNYLTYTVLHKKIEKIMIRDNRILKCSTDKLQTLEQDYFCHAFRHGKYCILQAKKGDFLILHFGMTGKVQYYKKGSEPDHSSLIIHFSNGYKLAYITIRKLGKIYISPDKKSFVQKMVLGPDALSINKQEFTESIQPKKGMIKSALMEQKTISGIGNIYSDEILYQSFIHPQRKTNTLSKTEIDVLYHNMHKVCQTAIEIKVQPEKFPTDWLITRREPGSHCGLCEGSIEKKSVNGRSCYYCNRHQK